MSITPGSTAPGFTQDSTDGPIIFHRWAGDTQIKASLRTTPQPMN